MTPDNESLLGNNPNTDPESEPTNRAEGVSSEMRDFSTTFATENGLPGLVEDAQAHSMRAGIVDQARLGTLAVDSVRAYADHLKAHFAQAEDLKPEIAMAVAQVVHFLHMVALKCERGKFNDAYADLYGDEFGSVYSLVENMKAAYPESDFQNTLDAIKSLSDQIPQEEE